jgi:two-component system response regulator YesN
MNLRPLEKKAVVLVRTYITEHYREEITVDRLSQMSWLDDQVNLRSRRLHEAFAALFLQTIHDYLIQVRMEKAKVLLSTTDLSIKAVAISVGYRRDSSFGPAFKKYFGVSPSSYRYVRVEE